MHTFNGFVGDDFTARGEFSIKHPITCEHIGTARVINSWTGPVRTDGASTCYQLRVVSRGKVYSARSSGKGSDILCKLLPDALQLVDAA